MDKELENVASLLSSLNEEKDYILKTLESLKQEELEIENERKLLKFKDDLETELDKLSRRQARVYFNRQELTNRLDKINEALGCDIDTQENYQERKM